MAIEEIKDNISIPLDLTDKIVRCQAYLPLTKEEESKWLQRAEERDVLEGDRNATYFMIEASSHKRKRKNNIISRI